MSTQEEIIKRAEGIEKRQNEAKQTLIEQNKAEAKKFEDLKSKVLGFRIGKDGGGHVLIVKTGVLVQNAVGFIYDFWKRNFGTPLTIIITDDPEKTKLQLRTVAATDFRKSKDGLNLLIFKQGEVSDIDAAFFRDYARRHDGRPVLTLTLENPTTDIAAMEIAQ